MANSWAIEPGADEGLVDVLFVGSDSDLADMYRLKLELDGYRVRMAPTLRNWSGSKPDLVFVDLEEPDGSGFAELTRLRTDRRLSGVPAILLVSESEAELTAHGLNLTPQEYLLRARPSIGLNGSMGTWSEPGRWGEVGVRAELAKAQSRKEPRRARLF